MDIQDIYAKRLTALIDEVTAALEQIPAGPDREKMILLLAQMERIVQERLGVKT